MSGVRLLFCMPTHNYSRFIGAVLESVLSQMEIGVEIVVLDSGSTDDTQDVVEGSASSWPAVRYIRRNSRGGIDRDLASSVELPSYLADARLLGALFSFMSAIVFWHRLLHESLLS